MSLGVIRILAIHRALNSTKANRRLSERLFETAWTFGLQESDKACSNGIYLSQQYTDRVMSLTRDLRYDRLQTLLFQDKKLRELYFR